MLNICDPQLIVLDKVLNWISMLEPRNIKIEPKPENTNIKEKNEERGKKRILLQLGWMDIDYAIRKDKSSAIIDESSPANVALYEQWEWSNQFRVMFIKSMPSIVEIEERESKGKSGSEPFNR